MYWFYLWWSINKKNKQQKSEKLSSDLYMTHFISIVQRTANSGNFPKFRENWLNDCSMREAIKYN